MRSEASRGSVCGREEGLAYRFQANLALVHMLRGEDIGRALEYANLALDAARQRRDAYFEAVTCNIVGQLLRKKDPAAALELLTDASRVAETLGYSHLLSATLRQLALLELEGASTTPHRAAVLDAVKKLQRCHKISTSNGLLRAACDDALNMYAARLEHRIGTRDEALTGLEAALKEAKAIQYKGAQIDLQIAL
jgi:hypothetical protein